MDTAILERYFCLFSVIKYKWLLRTNRKVIFTSSRFFFKYFSAIEKITINEIPQKQNKKKKTPDGWQYQENQNLLALTNFSANLCL